jgi:hypothetical protein
MVSKVQKKNLTNMGRGRPKGTPNKMTMQAKEAISYAAEGLGGAERLVEWAKEDPQNEKVFWAQIYPKLLPLQVTGNNGGPIQTEAVLEIVGIANQSRDSE